MEHKAQEWRQYLIALIAGLSLFITGYCLGWTSPINIKLADPEQTPLPELVTLDEEAWIGSLLTIGAMFGPFLGGFAVSKLGRKWALTTACLPLLVSWSLIAAASDILMLYIARLCVGLYVGMMITVSPLYLGEIATNEVRGAIVGTLAIFMNLGFLVVYSVGPYVSYGAVAYIAIGLGACLFIATLFAPESPYYYLAKGDVDSAGDCLMKIRGKTRDGVQSELDKLALEVSESMKNSARLIDVFRGTNLKVLYLACGLMMAQQFCGINAVLFYMTNIFEAAGTNLDSAISTIIIGVVQVMVSPLFALLVDRLGRRALMLSSCAGAVIAHGLLGTYFQLEENGNPIVESIGFLPLVSLILFVSMYSWGIGSIPIGFVAEVIPVEVKAVTIPMVMSFCWIMSFIVTRFFGPLAEVVGMGPIFWIFGGCCLLAFIFSWFFLPETKGKGFQEIQDLLKSGKLK